MSGFNQVLAEDESVNRLVCCSLFGMISSTDEGSDRLYTTVADDMQQQDSSGRRIYSVPKQARHPGPETEIRDPIFFLRNFLYQPAERD